MLIANPHPASTLILLLARSSPSSALQKEMKSRIHRVCVTIYSLCITDSPTELENLPDVVNDLDIDFTENPTAGNAYQRDARNIRKVREVSEKLKVNIIHPLRPGRKLLVLDIDYSQFLLTSMRHY